MSDLQIVEKKKSKGKKSKGRRKEREKCALIVMSPMVKYALPYRSFITK